MIPDDGLCFPKHVIGVLVNYFLNPETSVAAIETTLTCLLGMEQEYHQKNVSAVLYSLWKLHHLEKINIFKAQLNSAKTNNMNTAGMTAINFLLEFYRKSEDWYAGGYIKGPSINMRLSCELLCAAGVKEDVRLLLQQYPAVFLSEIESATNKHSIAVVTSSPAVTHSPFLHPSVLQRSPFAILPLSQGSLPRGTVSVFNQPTSAPDTAKRAISPSID